MLMVAPRRIPKLLSTLVPISSSFSYGSVLSG
jgi:hypothetical protein